MKLDGLETGQSCNWTFLKLNGLWSLAVLKLDGLTTKRSSNRTVLKLNGLLNWTVSELDDPLEVYKTIDFLALSLTFSRYDRIFSLLLSMTVHFEPG